MVVNDRVTGIGAANITLLLYKIINYHVTHGSLKPVIYQLGHMISGHMIWSRPYDMVQTMP